MENIVEVASQSDAGAKINLTVDLAPEDCFIMCAQLFERLTDDEKKKIIGNYIKERDSSKQ